MKQKIDPGHSHALMGLKMLPEWCDGAFRTERSGVLIQSTSEPCFTTFWGDGSQEMPLELYLKTGVGGELVNTPNTPPPFPTYANTNEKDGC